MQFIIIETVGREADSPVRRRVGHTIEAPYSGGYESDDFDG